MAGVFRHPFWPASVAPLGGETGSRSGFGFCRRGGAFLYGPRPSQGLFWDTLYKIVVQAEFSGGPRSVNEVAALIAALVGSSGVASIVAGGTQFRRTHRLRAQLKELDEAKHLVTPESTEHAALQASVGTIALELAASVLIKHDSRRLVLFGISLTSAVGAYLLTAGIIGPGPSDVWFFQAPKDSVMSLAGLIIFLTGYVALLVYLYLGITARRRERFISRLLFQGSETSDSDAILRRAHHLNYHFEALRKALKLKAKRSAAGTDSPETEPADAGAGQSVDLR